MDIYEDLAKKWVEQGTLSQQAYSDAQALQLQQGGNICSHLVQQGHLSLAAYAEQLAQALNIPLFDLKNYQHDPLICSQLSEAVARQFQAVLLDDQGDAFLVGMVDPLNLAATDELRQLLQRPLNIALVMPSELQGTLDRIYRRTTEISNYATQLRAELGQPEGARTEEDAGDIDAPVIKLLRSIFEDAVQVNASDIHIEPAEKILRIRLRVDGVLQEQIIKEQKIATAIIVRLKLMANLDIAERRIPQDGRFRITLKGKVIDFRLSTLPTHYGEGAVMRLLDNSVGLRGLRKLGMPKKLLAQFNQILTVPHGVFLVTGPTGSGKSTTLYGVLNQLNTVEKKILTVEDPIEYNLDRINQTQVNTKVGLTFSKVLRAALRQDPDIIMLGEMRDHETASIAIRAALTGHLVLSTLHTNDSASTVLRLIDMDIEGYLVAATLRGVLAQRLIRCICPHCVAPETLSKRQQAWLSGVTDDADSIQCQVGKGCAQCNNSGYAGRVGIFELLMMNEEMVEALRTNNPMGFMKAAKQSLGEQLLIDQGLQLLRQGQTSITEVVRVLGEL